MLMAGADATFTTVALRVRLAAHVRSATFIAVSRCGTFLRRTSALPAVRFRAIAALFGQRM